MSNFVVKLIHAVTGDVRRITLPAPPTVATLRDAVHQQFGLRPRTVKLTYVDEEGDEITIHDDASFADAVSAAEKIVRVKVTPVEGKASSEHRATAVEAPSEPLVSAPKAASVPVRAPSAPPSTPASSPDEAAGPFTATEDDIQRVAEAFKRYLHTLPAGEKGFLMSLATRNAELLPFALSYLPSVMFSGQYLPAFKQAVQKRLVLKALRTTLAVRPQLLLVATLVAPLRELLLKAGYSADQVDQALGSAPEETASECTVPAAEPEEAVHHQVICDVCGASPIVGARFKCAICKDFDLCGVCEEKNATAIRSGNVAESIHEPNHPFLKLLTPAQAPTALVAVVSEDHERRGPWRGRGGFGWMRRHQHGAKPGGEDSGADEAPHPFRGFGCGARGGRGGHHAGRGSWRCRDAWQNAAAADIRNPVATQTADTEEQRLLDLAIKESLTDVASTAATKKSTVAQVATAPTILSAGADPSSPPEYSAKFVGHITFADRSAVVPGATFVKCWRMRNEGELAWPAGTALTFVGGEQMGAPASVTVPQAAPGEEVDIAVPFVAPSQIGRHTSYWRLIAPWQKLNKHGVKKDKSVRFGQRIWADIFVENSPVTSSDDATSTDASSGDEFVAANVAAATAVKEQPAPTPANNSNAAAVLAALLAPAVTAPQLPVVPKPAVVSAPVVPSTVAPVLVPNPPDRWEVHLTSLNAMGFTDNDRNILLLEQFDGNLMRVVNVLLESHLRE